MQESCVPQWSDWVPELQLGLLFQVYWWSTEEWKLIDLIYDRKTPKFFDMSKMRKNTEDQSTPLFLFENAKSDLGQMPKSRLQR